MITPELFRHTVGTWYLDTRLYNSTWEPGLTVKITSFTSKCLFWDTEEKTWSTDGCRVGLEKVLAAAHVYKNDVHYTEMCCLCLRWERTALQSKLSVCVTTSLSLGAPSS